MRRHFTGYASLLLGALAVLTACGGSDFGHGTVIAKDYRPAYSTYRYRISHHHRYRTVVRHGSCYQLSVREKGGAVDEVCVPASTYATTRIGDRR